MSIYPQHVLLPFFLFFVLFSFTTCEEETFKVGVVRDKFLTYASSDTLIYNGIVYWRDWVNVRGGLYYNGSAKQVEVIAIDSSTPDPSQIVPFVTAAYTSLVNDYKVNLIVSPYNGDRTSAAINVSETYKIINFVPASFLDFQFKSNNSFIFNDAMPSPKIAAGSLQVLVAKGAKNYVMLRRPDTVSMRIASFAMKYLAANNVQPLFVIWVNETSNQADKFISDLRGALMAITTATGGIDFDIFIYAGPTTEFSSIAPVFAQVAPKAKSAALLLPLSRYEQQSDQLGAAGNYWVASTRFDRDFNMGESGKLGGTTSEFVADFSAKFGFPPSTFDAVTPALLMSYYVAVNATNSINATKVRAFLKSMGTIQTFACPISYFLNGTNMYSQLVPMQFVNGEGRILTGHDVIYPAPFHAAQKSVSVKLIMAIVIPTASVIVVAVALGMTYVRRQHAQVVKALVQAEEGERRNYKIDYSSVTIGSPIGCGGFGIVFKGEYRGADVAIKKLKSQNMNKAELAEFAKESAIMIGLRHPNILLFMGVCLEPASLCIITEFMPRGSLHDIVHNDKLKLPFPLVKSMALDILKGLQFIHSAGIIHRDLKSPNLLVDRNWGIKIADFGLSAAKAKLDDDVQISLLWTAPEVLTIEPNCYSEKSDIYSFAIVLWELLARKTPYKNLLACAIAPAVVKGHRPPIDEKWDETFARVITKCWAHNPADRLLVKDARALAEQAHADPGFEIGGSSSLLACIDKAKPPTDKVTFIYTSVAHSAELWEHDPHVMRRSLLLHNKILRDFMVIHYGYEVKYNADSFLIAFADPIKAVIFSLSVQTALLHAPWDDVLLRHPEAAEKRDSQGIVICRGLSICMGIHTTPTVHTRDAATGRMEYFSDEMGFAATFAAHAAKGWLCMGPDLYTCVMSNADKLSQFTIESKGVQNISCGKELNLYQMTLAAFKEREKAKTEVPNTPTGDDDSPTFQFPAGAEKWRIQFESIDLKEKIGAGSFGEVRLGNYKGRKIAVKQILKQKLTDDALLELYVESTILSSLNHPNILEFCGMCLNLPNVCMVTEYMEKGSLAQLIHTTPCVLTWDQRLKMARDMAQGMAYLHSKNVIHRDVKPTNMLVGTDLTVKIGDFGFSRMKAENQTMTQVGTVAYSAPEVFEGLRYTDKADVYSFGILLWELVTCKRPWEKTHSLKIVAAVTSGQRLPVTNLPSGAPSKLVSTLQECWDQVPDNRPSFAQIVVKLS